MATAQHASDIAALRLQIIDAGWRPVPASPHDKSCHVLGWPTIEPNDFYVENWTRTHPAHTLTSIVCGQHIVALDLDVLDPERADRVQALAFHHLGITDFARIGRPPKRLLVFRQAYEPQPQRQNGQSAPTSIRSETVRFADGGGLIEVLSTGRQFVAFGIHPETGRPYRWVGDANPAEDTPAGAPLVTQEQIDAFIAAVHTEIAPLGVNGSTGKPSATDARRAVNADGLVTDGRENLLRDCIWQAANEIAAAGDVLTAQSVAARGWELFSERAVLTDGKYSPQHALSKARATVRRMNEGRVTLGTKLQTAEITYSAKPHRMTVRAALRETFGKFTATVMRIFVTTIMEMFDA